MTRFRVLSICLLALLNTAALAELPPEVVKDLDLYVGEWATQVEIDGKVYRGQWIANWSDDRTCLDTYWSGTMPTGPARGTRVHGWDAAARKVLVVDFGSKGSSSIERYSLTKNGSSEGSMAGIDEEGNRFEGTARTNWDGPDYFTWTVTRDGQTLEHHFKRGSRVTKPVHVPTEVQESLDLLVGTWSVESTRDGNPWGKATWKTYWADGKPCLHCTQTWEDENGVDLGAGMWGYDLAEKQLVYTQYYVTGANATLKFKITEKGIHPGTTLKGTVQGVMDDGTVITAPASIEFVNANHYIYRASESQKGNGPKMPGAELHFRKQP